MAGLPQAAREQITGVVRASGGAAIDSLHRLPLGDQIVAAASGAAVDAARTVCFLAAGFILLGLVATLALPRQAADGGAGRG